MENIIDAWKIEKDTRKSDVSFAEFLDSRLKRALTFEEYSEKDRILVAKILASKGFFAHAFRQRFEFAPRDIRR